ncbi:MAG: hypothetical protein K0Q66_2302, partial [Chitinophagaceae bacterium]|nr:hypothetical protein [Chitinophagaceae bacterium]
MAKTTKQKTKKKYLTDFIRAAIYPSAQIDLFHEKEILAILYQSLNPMRKLLPLTLLLLPAICLAQKNAVKVNLSSLLLNNYHIQYERKILPKITVNLGFRYMPKSGLPLEETLNKYGGLDDPSLKLGEFEMGNTAITIEPRLYLSKKALKGFYIAPYARMATFDLNLPFSYSYDSDPGPGVTTTTKTATFVGKIKSTSGGLMFGTQFSIAKKLALDIWW